MSFTIRTVTARAGGGEIVRSRRVDANMARIGRGTDCEIHLPDLAVQLHHATASFSGGMISIAAVQGATFEWNGRAVAEARFRPAEQPNLLFGSHRLAFASGDEPGNIDVTLFRIVGSGEPADTGRLRGIFSLGSTLFSTRRAAWLLGLAILFGCLAAPAAVFFFGWGDAKIRPDQQWSPGPLSAGHHFLARKCEACHRQAFVSVQDSACLACHRMAHPRDRAGIAARLNEMGSPFAPVAAPDHAQRPRLLRARVDPNDVFQRVGFALGDVFGHPALRCAACHTEHVGQHGEHGLPPRPARSQLKNFDCVACHRAIRERLPDSLLADAPGWARHPEFRPVLFVSPQGARVRKALGDVAHEYSGLRFSHWQHLHDPAVIDEAVKLEAPRYGAPLTCRNCHAPARDGRSFVPIDMPRDCSACHDLKYAVAANGTTLVLKHGDPDTVVRQLQIALGSSQPLRVMDRRRPGYMGDPYRDPLSGIRHLSPEQRSDVVRSVFQRGGLCFGCHTFVQPQGAQRLSWRIRPVQLTYGNVGAVRYFPWSAFDHALPQHHEDVAGRPTCRDCHHEGRSAVGSYMTLPSVRECASCHGATRATTTSPASSDCMDCHGYHRPDWPLSASFDDLHRVRRIAPAQAVPAMKGM